MAKVKTQRASRQKAPATKQQQPSNPKRVKPLPKFGAYLKEARERAGYTQADVGGVLKDSKTQFKGKASQAMVAQYETGRVADPDPLVLQDLATLYNLDYVEMVTKLAREKYSPNGTWADESTIDGTRWQALETLAHRHKLDVDAVDNPHLAQALARSRVSQLTMGAVLDVQAIGRWQHHLAYVDQEPGLQELWIVAPRFLDDRSAEIFDTVKDNITADITYSYFIYQEDIGRWQERIKDRLLKLCGDEYKDHIRAYALNPQPDRQQSPLFAPRVDRVTDLLNTYYMIANPNHYGHEMAYQCIRQHGETALALRLDPFDTKFVIDVIAPLAIFDNRLDRRGDS